MQLKQARSYRDIAFYRPLFNLMLDKHDTALTHEDMDEIVLTVNRMINDQIKAANRGANHRKSIKSKSR